MSRYIDVEEAIDSIRKGAGTSMQKMFAECCLLTVPATDVVPRAELDKLEYTLLGVMHSVDKWLESDELEQDEVNRSITMREKTLRIIETLKSETARDIGEKIYNLSEECGAGVMFWRKMRVYADELRGVPQEESK